MNIPLSRPFIDQSDKDQVMATLSSGWLTQGPQVEKFENSVSQYLGIPHTVAVANCTCALSLVFQTLGIGHNDIVICPSFSFIATANSIRTVGAEPVFCDVDEISLNLDPKKVRELIETQFTKRNGILVHSKHKEKKLRAIILVHQFGNPADLKAFQKIRKEYGLKLVEDAACAIGSEFDRMKISGINSDAACFSLHPRKIITCGEGGFITTKSKTLTKALKSLRQHGMTISDKVRHGSKTYKLEHYAEVGYNYRLSDVSAALANTQLNKLDSILEKFETNFQLYKKGLAGLKQAQLVDGSIFGRSNRQSIYLRLEDSRDALRLINYLREKNIFTKRSIQPIHLEKPYVNSLKSELAVTEKISKTDILLPQFYDLQQSEIAKVCEEIEAFFKSSSV